MPTYTDTIYNGLWEYRPDLSKQAWRQGATTVENVRCGSGRADGRRREDRLDRVDHEEPVCVRGRANRGRRPAARGSSSVRTGSAGRRCPGGSLDRFFSTVGPPYYEYQVKCELGAGASLKKLAIINDLQMAPLALPEMAVGENQLHLQRRDAGDAGGPHHA